MSPSRAMVGSATLVKLSSADISMDATSNAPDNSSLTSSRVIPSPILIPTVLLSTIRTLAPIAAAFACTSAEQCPLDDTSTVNVSKKGPSMTAYPALDNSRCATRVNAWIRPAMSFIPSGP